VRRHPCFETFRDSRAFSGMAAFSAESLTLTIDGRPEKVLGLLASASYFDVLGVEPAAGRLLVASDERLDPAVAVISHRYWQRRFGGGADVVGRTLGYNGRVLTIVGVSPPAFSGLEPGTSVDVTVPITIVGPERLGDGGAWWFSIIGRLAAGATHTQAAADIDPRFQAFMRSRGASAEPREMFARMRVTSAAQGADGLRGRFGRPIVLLMGVTGVVLLIACANVANLLLGRAAARRQEFATRTAMGASRSRLVRQLLTEAFLLSAAGGVFGVMVATWAASSLTAFFAGGRNPIVLDVAPDARLVGFAVLLCLLTSLLFGLVPALRTARVDASVDIRQPDAASGARRTRISAGAGLVVVQMTLSLVLLVATSLLSGTVAHLRGIDAGFEPRGVTSLDLELLPADQPAERLSARWGAVLERVEAVPGVESAGVSIVTPLSGRHYGVRVRVEGFVKRSDRDQNVALNHVSPGYFTSVGTRVTRGRAFTPRDHVGAPRVALVNETAARFYFPNRNPLGQRLELRGIDGAEVVHEIIGVVADAKHFNLRDAAPRFVYVPVQQPTAHLDALTLTARTRGDARALVDPLRRALLALGPDIIIGHVTTLEQQLDRSILRERLVSTLSAWFGVLGLTLAAIGLFSVMSHGVARRRREIAVRMALGATAPAIGWAVLRESIAIAAVGALIGVPLSVLTGRALTSLLVDVQPTSTFVVAGCAGAVFLVAIAAGYLPARRAASVDPMTILRGD